MPGKTAVVTMRLSPQDLKRIEAVQVLENVDRTTLLREFIEDGLRQRVLRIYQEEKITATRAAEILGMSLRRFFEMLERAGIPVNWNSAVVRDYLRAKYGE